MKFFDKKMYETHMADTNLKSLTLDNYDSINEGEFSPSNKSA